MHFVLRRSYIYIERERLFVQDVDYKSENPPVLGFKNPKGGIYIRVIHFIPFPSQVCLQQLLSSPWAKQLQLLDLSECSVKPGSSWIILDHRGSLNWVSSPHFIHWKVGTKMLKSGWKWRITKQFFFSHHGIGIQKSVFHHFMEIWWDMTLESIHFHPQKSYSWVSDAKALVQLGRCFWKASYKAQSAACGTRWNPLCCKSKQNGARDPSISQREKQSLLLSIFIIFYLHFLVFHQVEMICLKPKLKCSTVPSHQPSRFLSIVSHGVGSMSLPHGHWIWWCVSNPACAILINFHWPTLYYVELCRYISNLTPFESFW